MKLFTLIIFCLATFWGCDSKSPPPTTPVQPPTVDSPPVPEVKTPEDEQKM